MSTESDAAINQLLMLYLTDQMTRRYSISGKVKFLKVLFEAQRRSMEKGIRALTYFFYKWDYGPFSTEALDDLQWLVNHGYIAQNAETGIEITQKGHDVVEQTKTYIERNEDIVKLFGSVINEFGLRTGRASKDVVYDSRLPNTKIRVREVEKGEPLLGPLEERDVRESLFLDEDELETILVELDEDIKQSISRGISDIATGHVRPYVRSR